MLQEIHLNTLICAWYADIYWATGTYVFGNFKKHDYRTTLLLTMMISPPPGWWWWSSHTRTHMQTKILHILLVFDSSCSLDWINYLLEKSRCRRSYVNEPYQPFCLTGWKNCFVIKLLLSLKCISLFITTKGCFQFAFVSLCTSLPFGQVQQAWEHQTRIFWNTSLRLR